MRNVVLILGKVGILISMLLTYFAWFVAAKSRMEPDTTIVLLLSGVGLFVVSLVVVLIARVFVSNREEKRSTLNLE